MTYVKNLHVDELRDELGNVTQEGTTVTAAKLNHIEEGIEEAHELIDGLASEVDGAGTALTTHMEEAAPHGATVAATAGKLMIRDEAGRSQVEDPAAAKDIVNKQTLETAAALVIPKGINSAGTDTYVLTIPGITAYTDGMPILMRTSVANTAAATLNINTIGAKAIGNFKAGVYAALSTGAIPANSWILLVYSETAAAGDGAWIIMNVMDADKLDGQEGAYYRNADQVDGLHFRDTSGYLEYSTDGVVWSPVKDVKSINHYTASDSAAATIDVPINAVSAVNKALIEHDSVWSTGSTGQGYKIEFTSTTNVRITKGTAIVYSNIAGWAFTVVEYY